MISDFQNQTEPRAMTEHAQANAMQPREIMVEKGTDRLFPKALSNTPKQGRLRVTDIALFSTSPPEQSRFIMNVIMAYHDSFRLKTMTITDANGCIGGNAYEFVKFFGTTNFVEISKLHTDIFVNNLQVLGLDKRNDINVITNNYLNVCSLLKQDIIFLDPPWGGSEYAAQENIDLYYDKSGSTEKVSITDLIRDTLSHKAKMIVLKLPKNFNVNTLLNDCGFKFKDLIIIMDKKYATIYYIVVLSNIPPRGCVVDRYKPFGRLGYRHIIWKYI